MFSYSTISFYNHINVIISTTGDNGIGIGSEFVDGSTLRYLSWSIANSLLFEEFWSSTAARDTAHDAFIIGNNGYIMPKHADLLPAALSVNGSWVPRGQRPALWTIRNHNKHYDCVNDTKGGICRLLLLQEAE